MPTNLQNVKDEADVSLPAVFIFIDGGNSSSGLCVLRRYIAVRTAMQQVYQRPDDTALLTPFTTNLHCQQIPACWRGSSRQRFCKRLHSTNDVTLMMLAFDITWRVLLHPCNSAVLMDWLCWRGQMLYQLAEADPARFEQVIAERGAIDMTPDEIAQFESELAKQRIKYGPEAVDAPDPTKPLPIPDAPPVHRFEKPLPFGKNRDFAFAGPGMSVLEDQGSSPSHRQNEEEQPAQPAAPAQQAPFGTALDVAGAQSNAPPAIVKEAPNIEAPVEADWSSFESIMTPVSAAGAAAEATQNAPYSSFTAPSLTPNMRSKLFPQPRDTQPTVAQSTAPAESDARATTTAGALATEDSAATGAASETRRLYQAAVSPALPPDYKPDDPWGDGDFGEAESDAQARAATRDAAQEQAEIERGAAAALEGSKQVKLPANFRRMPHPTKAKPAPTKPAVARSLYRRRAGPVPPEEPEPEIISLKIASEEDTSLARQHKALYIPMLARSLDLEAMKADEAKAASTTRNTPTADGAMGDSVEVAGKQDDGLSLEPHSFQGMQSRQVSGQRKVGIERTSKQRASKKVGNWKSIDPIAMEQLAFAANHDKIMVSIVDTWHQSIWTPA